jgi:phosphate transport system ATP-binding protein
MQIRQLSGAPAAEMATALPLRVRGLRVRAGGRELLRGIDVDFPAGQITAVVGPTGCGKTTLLRALNRLHDDSTGLSVSGTVELDGADIYRDLGLREVRRRIGMLFQRPNPFPQSIQENVVIGARVHGLTGRSGERELAEARLREVGLWDAVKDRLGSNPYRLSGGQQQLLCLARALAVRPDVLLLDEPTSSLDPWATAQIEQLIRELRERITVVIVSHNLSQVARVADRVLFMVAGERVELASAETFFRNPSDPRTRRYVAGEAMTLPAMEERN